MCGIFGIVQDKSQQAAQTILAGLKKLEYRGYDSWGIAILDSSHQRIALEKLPGKIGNATTTLEPAFSAIGHTRWATHGGVTQANAHPHQDCTKKLAVVHNGIVENFSELKQKLLKQGHHFSSATDTEVIVHLIEEKKKTLHFQEAVFETFLELHGANAFAVLDVDSQTIIACRHGSPLVIGKNDEEKYVASDILAFVDKTKEFYPLEDGEAVILSPQGLSVIDVSSRTKKTFSFQTAEWQDQQADKGEYEHFFLKEVLEQPDVIRNVASNKLLNTQEFRQLFTKKRVFFTGCGSAYFAGLFGHHFFLAQGILSQTVFAHEFSTLESVMNKDSVIVAVSQSGETADTLDAVKKAKAKGATIISLLNNIHSSLARISDHVLPVHAGPEIAVVSTKAFLAQISTLYALSGTINNSVEKKQKELGYLAVQLENWLTGKSQKRIEHLAHSLQDHTDIFLIGKGLLVPAIFEMALKIKESSYIHAEAFPSGELKHGVLSLIKDGTACIVAIQTNSFEQDTLSGATEINARGGQLFGVATKDYEVFSEAIIIPDLQELTCFFHIVVGQLLGYYLAIARHFDPDKPRNLAKSVTVK